MSHTILAVDDSVTLRKVLEITFAGTDMRCITAASADAAIERVRAEKPQLVIADVSMDPKTGYDLCAMVKQAAPGTRVIILSSKHNPYDAARGAAVGADDHMDKPFDTQQMIDRARKVIESKGDAPAAAAPGPTGRQPTQPSIPALQPPAPPARAKTLMFGHGGGANVPNFMPKGAGAPPAAAPLAAPPAAEPKAAAPVAKTHVTPPAGIPAAAPVRGMTQTTPSAAIPAGIAVAQAAAHAVDAAVAHKLDGLGLTPQQAEAVLALSREVVERVVWEVVPVLAETLIKEELARLTK